MLTALKLKRLPSLLPSLPPKKPRLCLGAHPGPSEDDSSYGSDSEGSASSRESRSKSQLTDLRQTKRCKTISNHNDDEEPSLSDPYVATCIDACNGFNELNCKAMLWTVRHLWPSGYRFVFNCYWHHSLLMLRRKNDSYYTSNQGRCVHRKILSLWSSMGSLWCHSLYFSEKKHLL